MTKDQQMLSADCRHWLRCRLTLTDRPDRPVPKLDRSNLSPIPDYLPFLFYFSFQSLRDRIVFDTIKPSGPSATCSDFT